MKKVLSTQELSFMCQKIKPRKLVMFCVKNEDVNYQIDDGENNMNTLKEGERILVIQLFVTDSQSQT